MKTIWLLCGTPGSGKSTWAKSQIEKNGGIWISRDVIRFEIIEDGPYATVENRKLVFQCIATPENEIKVNV